MLDKKSFTFFALAACLALTPLPACAAPKAAKAADKPAENAQTSADQFIQKLGDRAVSILADKATDQTTKEALFRDMMHETFDLKTIGRFVLGRNAWMGATIPQQEEYSSLFEKLVIQIYTDRFAFYSGEIFKVISSRPEGDRDFIVTSHVVRPASTQPIVVDWRVRSTEGHMGIIDVIVEGISMSVTQRQEYSAIVQRNDGKIDELLKLMHERLDNTAAQNKKDRSESWTTAQ
ncbi:MAG: ABC transporter substrate-binding protein [Alphaproteobacteria bacterium]